jgi:hypothetical protein
MLWWALACKSSSPLFVQALLVLSADYLLQNAPGCDLLVCVVDCSAELVWVQTGESHRGVERWHECYEDCTCAYAKL